MEKHTQPARQGRPIRIGTRASLLARTQTGWVVDQLRSHGHEVEVVTVSTQGDTRADVPIAAIGGDGVFVRELERALLDRRIDSAVHSLKDLPTEETPGLTVACVPVRAMPFDVLVAREPCTLESLPPGAVVGTSSLRRVAQVKAIRGDLDVRAIRGNVDSRLRRLDGGEYDCLILAGAGLERLGLASRITHVLRPDAFWPAVSQGGCLAPIGAWGHQADDGHLELGGCVLEDSGDRVIRIAATVRAAVADDDRRGVSGNPESLGKELAGLLLARGAADMLARVRARVSPP
jgi:porphobilinogen deaminase